MNAINQENEQKESTNKNQEYNDPNYRMPTDIDGYISPEDVPPENIAEEDVVAEIEGEQQYIMGKPSRAKEKKVKIKDINANEGNYYRDKRKVLRCPASLLCLALRSC